MVGEGEAFAGDGHYEGSSWSVIFQDRWEDASFMMRVSLFFAMSSVKITRPWGKRAVRTFVVVVVILKFSVSLFLVVIGLFLRTKVGNSGYCFMQMVGSP